MVVEDTCIILILYWYFQIQQYMSILEQMNGGDDTTTIKVLKEMVIHNIRLFNMLQTPHKYTNL